MTGSPYPPDYIKLSPAIACADVDDALIVTMARILGLCWEGKYRRSPPYTPDRLAELLGRPRTTLYRHLNKLQDLRWLRVDHRERRLMLQPLIRVPEGQAKPASPGRAAVHQPTAQEPNGNRDLHEALQEAGIIGRPFHELLRRNVDPAVVRAWHLWTWMGEQAWLDNPAGYIVNRLRDGDEPPAEFLELAQLTPDEEAVLREGWACSEQTMGWPSLDGNDRLQRIAPLWVEIRNAKQRNRE